MAVTFITGNLKDCLSKKLILLKRLNHGKVVNIYIVYEISKSINISNCLTLENCFGGYLV